MIDEAILRPGRLGRILFVELPSTEDRLEILKTITKVNASSSAEDTRTRDTAKLIVKISTQQKLGR